MAAWMLYVTAVSGALGLAGLLAERGVRHLGRPARWVWVTVLAATVALPVSFALHASGRTVAGDVAGAADLAGAAAAVLQGSSAVDVVLMAAWVTGSLILVANLRLAAWTLRRNERGWRTRSVGGQRVLVSDGFGPGVIGAFRPRMVLPDWVLDSDPSLQRSIVLHEVEHVRAGDTRLLFGGLVVALLVPWCLPVWWQLHRLGAAVEIDCDARVLAAGAPAKAYANALVAVAGGRSRGLLPVPALAPTRGELERRIRLITGGARGSTRTGLAFLAAALVLVVGLAGAPVPDLPAPGAEAEPAPAAGSTPVVTVILSVV